MHTQFVLSKQNTEYFLESARERVSSYTSELQGSLFIAWAG